VFLYWSFRRYSSVAYPPLLMMLTVPKARIARKAAAQCSQREFPALTDNMSNDVFSFLSCCSCRYDPHAVPAPGFFSGVSAPPARSLRKIRKSSRCFAGSHIPCSPVIRLEKSIDELTALWHKKDPCPVYPKNGRFRYRDMYSMIVKMLF